MQMMTSILIVLLNRGLSYTSFKYLALNFYTLRNLVGTSFCEMAVNITLIGDENFNCSSQQVITYHGTLMTHMIFESSPGTNSLILILHKAF